MQFELNFKPTRLLLLFACLGLIATNAFAAKPFCGNDICEGNEPRTCPDDCDDDPSDPPPPPGGSESCGCLSGLPSSQARAGRAYVRDLAVGSNPVTKYEIRLPGNYNPAQTGGFPLLVYLHGWGGSYRSLPTQFARHAKNNGYIVVTPSGYGDGGRNSWNGYRSARLPDCLSREGYTASDCEAGPSFGPSTCVDVDDSRFDYCYDSCKDASGNCPKWDGVEASNTWNSQEVNYDGDYTCYWTTCLDSVAQIEALLDEIERDYCIDRSMIWVTGCSNGGMMVYELAKDRRTAGRFAGYVPQVGSPHPGFQQLNPALDITPSKFLGFWGTSDTTVPGVANFADGVGLDTNFNGWLYQSADSIAEQWADMNGLNAADPYDARKYSSTLECKAWIGQSPADAEIVRCFFQGGHSCPGFGNMPQMIWDFAQSHPHPAVPAAGCTP